VVSLDTLHQDIEYIKQGIDEIKAGIRDHETRIKALEEARAQQEGYARGIQESYSKVYKRQRLIIGILTVAVSIIGLVVAIRIR